VAEAAPPQVVRPQLILEEVATTGQSTPASSQPDSELINQVLALLGEAVITRLDAKVSLESVEVDKGRIRLSGLLLKNLDVGLRLNARATQRLAQTLQQRYAQNPSSSRQQLTQFLEILKLGVFNQLEINVHLSELGVRQINVDADDLQVEGLLLQVGATPPDPITGKPRSDTLQTLMDILRRTALNRIKAEAGLEKLNARRARIELNGLALQGFSLRVVLARAEKSQPQPAQ